MKMIPQWWIRLVGLIVFCLCVSAQVSLKECGEQDDKYAEVVERQENLTLTCMGIRDNDQVGWRLGLEGNTEQTIDAGTCRSYDPTGSNSCVEGSVSYILPTRRTSATESEGVIKAASNRASLQRKMTVVCQEMKGNDVRSSDNCPVDLITPAEGTCQARFITSSRPWTVDVRCDITNKRSSVWDRYQCRLYQKLDGQQHDKALTQWTRMNNSRTAGSSECRFSHPLDVNQPQNYRVRLNPGRVTTDVTFSGSSEISQPKAPSKKCSPTSYVKENAPLQCTCSVDSLGHPPGYLRWARGSNDDFDTDSPLEVGDRTQTSLTMTQTLTRDDHLKAQFRCDVVWAYDVTGDVKKARVGYPPSQVTFSINGGQPVTEDTEAIFTCTAGDARPSPNVTVEGPGRSSKTGGEELSVKHPVRCEDNGQYTCTARNGMGPDVTRTSNLSVTCGPRDISGSILPVYYNDEETGFSFDLVARPPPNQVTFAFLVSQKENKAQEVKGIALSGQCQQKEGVVYKATCTVAVHNVTSSGAAGLYRGTVKNKHGSLTFDFEVKVNVTEPVPPSPGPQGSTILAAVIGGGVAAVLVLVVVIVVVICRRKASVKKKTANGESVKYTAAAEPTLSFALTTQRQPLLPEENDHADNVYVNVGKDDYRTPAGENNGTTQKPQAAEPEGNVYAVVDKTKKKQQTTGATAPHDPDPTPEPEDNVYAVVDKTKKKQQTLPSASAPADVHPEVKVVDEGRELSEGPVYGNIDMHGQVKNTPQEAASHNAAPQDASPQNAAPQDPQGNGSGQEVNQDGLLYVSMDFSDRPSTAYPLPAPVDDGVLYSAVDFSRAAPAQ